MSECQRAAEHTAERGQATIEWVGLTVLLAAAIAICWLLPLVHGQTLVDYVLGSLADVVGQALSLMHVT